MAVLALPAGWIAFLKNQSGPGAARESKPISAGWHKVNVWDVKAEQNQRGQRAKLN